MIDERLYPQITDRHSVTTTCVGGGDGSLPVAPVSTVVVRGGSRWPPVGGSSGSALWMLVVSDGRWSGQTGGKTVIP